MLYIAFISALSGCAQDAKKPIALYVYHQFPPYILPSEHMASSLSDLYARALSNDAAQDFVVVPMVRSKINTKIDQGAPVILLWANAKWFDGVAPAVSETIIWDSNILVSLKGKGIVSNQPSALVGLRFCVMDGHDYGDLNPWLARGDIISVRANSYDECTSLLLSNELDVVQMQRSRFYNAAFAEKAPLLHIIEPSRDSFSRNVLLFNDAAQYLPLINRSIVNLKNNASWQMGLDALGNEHFIKLFDMSLHSLMRVKVDQ